MAVYTRLDDTALRALWSVYRDDQELIRAEGISAGSINTTYRLETAAGVFYLRINEHKTTDEVVYERDLLEQLARAPLGGVTSPRIQPTRVRGSFFLVERRAGRPVWASMFPALPGRDLAPFEVEAGHVQQVGIFLARAHLALRGHHGGRANPHGMSVVARWLKDLGADRRLAPDVRGAVEQLESALVTAAAHRRLLPRGVIHGDLFVDNTKWQRDALLAVFDWEMAGRDHLALDLAICLHAWCWRRDPDSPARGIFDPTRCRALLQGYQSVRPLMGSERRGLFVEALFAAVRFTASRIRDFEVPRAEHNAAQRTYLDYRDFLARLRAIESMGERGFRALTGLDLDRRASLSRSRDNVH